MDFEYLEIKSRTMAIRGAMSFGRDLEDLEGYNSLKSELMRSLWLMAVELDNLLHEMEKSGPSEFQQEYINAARAFLKYDLK